MEIVEIFTFEAITTQQIPLYQMSVSAGKPVPVENEIDKVIDLNEFLVEHPAATFFARVRGTDLKDVGINDDDILIVDRVKQPEDGKIVIVSIGEALSVKIYRNVNGEIFLQSRNKQFLPMSIEPYM
ncbi:MAG: S24 family peptidase, partial [FCB group bacterium]